MYGVESNGWLVENIFGSHGKVVRVIQYNSAIRKKNHPPNFQPCNSCLSEKPLGVKQGFLNFIARKLLL